MPQMSMSLVPGADAQTFAEVAEDDDMMVDVLKVRLRGKL